MHKKLLLKSMVYIQIRERGFCFRGKDIKILKATLSDLKGQPGSVLDNNLTIACGNKSIKIEEIQRQGKSKQKAAEFLLGSKIKKDLLLS